MRAIRILTMLEVKMNRRLRSIVIALAVLLPTVPALAQDRIEYYHVDAIGSVRAVTDSTGAVVARHDFFPFGEEYLPPPATTDAKRFAGKERDPETSLDYFGARYYRATAARFTTVDPVYSGAESLADPQRWNRYAYVRNNPLRFGDPDGREVRPLGDLALQRIRSTVPEALRSSIVVAGSGLLDKTKLAAVHTKDPNFLDLQRLANATMIVEVATAAGVNMGQLGYREFYYKTAAQVKAEAAQVGVVLENAAPEAWDGHTVRINASTMRVTLADGQGKTAGMPTAWAATTAAHEMYGHALLAALGLPWEHELRGYPRGQVNERIAAIEKRTQAIYGKR